MSTPRLDASRIINQRVDVSLISPHPDNPRVHPDEQLAQLSASHEQFGQYRSVVLWARPGGHYVQVAGHGYLEAARREGLTTIRADILPVDTDPVTVKAILVADNLHAQNSSDDETLLAQLLQEQDDAGFDLSALGTDEETLRQMLQALGDEVLAGDEQEDEDEPPEPDVQQTRCKVGDIWQLGRHTIAALNSTDPATYTKLFPVVAPEFVWADPPYGISIVATNGYVGGGEAYDIPFGGVQNRGDVGGGASHIRKTGKTYMQTNREKGTTGHFGPLASKPFGSTKERVGHFGQLADNIVKAGKYLPVIGDESSNTAITAYHLCADLFPHAVHVWWGANNYAHALPPSTCWIVWDKENTGMFADAELAWCSDKTAVRIFKHMWNGMLKDSEHGQRRVHPTQKPIALAEWAFEKYGTEKDTIFDPFLGSGISVIAAERMSGERRVIGCELSADYIEVIIRRWEALTGQTATLLERVDEVHHE